MDAMTFATSELHRRRFSPKFHLLIGASLVVWADDLARLHFERLDARSIRTSDELDLKEIATRRDASVSVATFAIRHGLGDAAVLLAPAFKVPGPEPDPGSWNRLARLVCCA